MPRLDSKITVGEIVTFIVLLLTAGAIYGQVNARVDFIDENGTKATRALQTDINSLRLEIVKLQTIMEEREKKEIERHAN